MKDSISYHRDTCSSMLIAGLVTIARIFTHRRTDYENVAKMEENCDDLKENGLHVLMFECFVPSR